MMHPWISPYDTSTLGVVVLLCLFLLFVANATLSRFDDDDRIQVTVPIIFSGGVGWIV